MSSKIRISRPGERADWQFLRDVCCRTAGPGSTPISPERWPFFGDWWIGPYEKLRPEWSYLAEVIPSPDGFTGRLATEAEESPDSTAGCTTEATDPVAGRLGYLTGCPDTRAFNREKRALFEWPLYLKIQLGHYAPTSDTKRWAERFFSDDWPERHFNSTATREVLEKFPAHLHMNLDASARGSGTGRLLVERYAEDLAAIGVSGIHLYCGEGPLAFYAKTGFRELDRVEYRPGVWVYRLVRHT